MENSVLVIVTVCCSVFALASTATSLPISSYDEAFSDLFGDNNLQVLKDGNSVHLSLDQTTGSGFVSHDIYLHGFFSASIKLPAYYTAGVVVAFYMSNGDMYEKNHDEIDFEFLGNIKGKDWKIQTNIYGNGSTNLGREERYSLWFDPSHDFHHYTILWTQDHIIFYVDNVAIREIKRTESLGGGFPSKPMTLYATIWDASEWATNGGKYKVNYKYAPYVAEFTNFVLHGCSLNPIELVPSQCDHETTLDNIIPMDKVKMESFRKKHMKYSYCEDKIRYKTPPAECVVNPKKPNRLQHHGKRHMNRESM
ncbi:hypothetical protein QVD17_05162 [Tagetes erecta]|uniref:Xyloglucan endotransglucosylase/hydrolase n=1 Tax=Tagetes erecta TaxID=13708 RepID=A0AAD8LI23_TARER|nr:hypothetical protein QVD17_05162 [Tagetes erecta]